MANASLGEFVECYRSGGPQLQLIALYDYVCHCYDRHPDLHSHRQSNNHCPPFTDQELMTIYSTCLGLSSNEPLSDHGFKPHLIAVDRLGKLPLPERIQFTSASTNDLTALRAERPYLSGGCGGR